MAEIEGTEQKLKRKKPRQDGRGNHLASTQQRINNRSFTLPEGRDEPNCKKVTLMIRPSVWEKCRSIAGDHTAQLIRDAIDLYLNSLNKNLPSDNEKTTVKLYDD